MGIWDITKQGPENHPEDPRVGKAQADKAKTAALGANLGIKYGTGMSPDAERELQRMDNLGSSNQGLYRGYGDSLAQQGRLAQNRQAALANYGQANKWRNQAFEGLGRLRSFYQQGAGPSVAQAQLGAAQDANMRGALGAAAHGGFRPAMAAGTAANVQAGGGAAMNRAQESDAWRGTQLGAMGLEGQSIGGMRAQDINSGQFNVNAQLNQRQMNDAYDMAMQQLALGNNTEAEKLMQDYEQLRQGIYSGQLAANSAYQQRMMAEEAAKKQRDAQGEAALIGAGGTLVAAGMVASDVRAKCNIRGYDMASHMNRKR